METITQDVTTQKRLLQDVLDKVNPSAIFRVLSIKIQYVKSDRNLRAQSHGLVCRVKVSGGFYKNINDAQEYFETLFKENSVIVRSLTLSEKTVKGSGFRGVRGNWKYAQIESTTLSFWVSIKQSS